VTGEDVRRGLETIDLSAARLKELGLEGFADPIKLTCSDHNGHKAAFIMEWDGTNYVKVTAPIEPMTQKVEPLQEAAAKDYTEKNSGWPKRTEPCDKNS
jgi:branched-chain amino acid transport system substrate-binding protein